MREGREADDADFVYSFYCNGVFKSYPSSY